MYPMARPLRLGSEIPEAQVAEGVSSDSEIREGVVLCLSTPGTSCNEEVDLPYYL